MSAAAKHAAFPMPAPAVGWASHVRLGALTPNVDQPPSR
jgi:hypothetical protein